MRVVRTYGLYVVPPNLWKKTVNRVFREIGLEFFVPTVIYGGRATIPLAARGKK